MQEAIELINLLLNKLTYHNITLDIETRDKIENFIWENSKKVGWYDFRARIQQIFKII